MATEIFCMASALVLVATGISLSWMEDRDRKNGLYLDHREYKFGYILKKMVKERFSGAISFVKKHLKQKKTKGRESDE